MENIVNDSPNLNVETVPVKEASTGLDAIAAKMAAMRNQVQATNPTGTGESEEAKTETPVAPKGVVSEEDSDTNLVEPEVAEPEAEYDEGIEESASPDEESVSTEDSSPSEIIDFLEFAEEHPNAKFKFKRNGKEIEIDAKKAAAILGQGAAISEDARQLKIEKAEFDEYKATKQAETEGLMLALEFTVRPQIQKAYDEIMKVQGYQNTFKQQLAQTQDPAARARLQANIQQNERYLAQQAQVVNQLKPQVDQFYDIRKKQVSEVLETSRKNFKDKELRNTAIYSELRDKISQGWEGANKQLVPGIDNIDLIASDEHLLSLVRDGLKYRDKPKSKTAGGSIAALTNKRSNTQIPSPKSELESLQAKARAGDSKAADNLLIAKMNALRAGRR